ncbi:MAG: hypothetical protein IKX34_01820 [Bacteroidales bacterium]|nr:hypothetical protein [Bacteroidales bacterium]
MNNARIIPELNYLLTQVEKHYGRRVATSTDFEALSVFIEHETGELISASTLKRLWGYVTSRPTPRKDTLDILSRFIGFWDFGTFCQSLKTTDAFASQFFTGETIHSSDLEPGTQLTIGWNPNRVVTLAYLGEGAFEVIASENAKLLPGDRFELSHLMKGYPLFIPRILRDGEFTPSYIAGNNGGLTLISLSARR